MSTNDTKTTETTKSTPTTTRRRRRTRPAEEPTGLNHVDLALIQALGLGN